MTTKASRKTAATSTARRKFLKTAAATSGAAAIGFPMIARSQTPVTFRFQSTWPTKDIFHEYALDYARKVNEMTGGRLKIDVLPAGSVVKAFDLIDAVNKGTLDGGHGVSAYWYGKNSAYSLFGTGPSFGMDANMLLSWYEYGGGKQLYNQLHTDIMKFDVVGLLYGPMPTQPLGWFKKQVSSANDFKGLKFRTVGLSVDLFKEMGSAVVSLPAGEIVPALDRGLIDAAEFNNASSDRLLGFPDVSKICMLQSYHQPLESFEVLFNKKRYDALPADVRSILVYAGQASSADMSWKAIDRYSKDYEAMKAQGVKFVRTPKEVLVAQLQAWDKVIAAKSAENPFFKQVLESQRKFAQRAVPWSNDTIVSSEFAYDYYFKKA